jgi:acyl-[acyl-carrier-protein]-phospholipid O-acyltransferase/long-chain-fatty-acid--[acyl-carrier-protein] ligase
MKSTLNLLSRELWPLFWGLFLFMAGSLAGWSTLFFGALYAVLGMGAVALVYALLPGVLKGIVLKGVLRGYLRLFHRIEVTGLEHYRKAGKRVLITPNHPSFLDAAVLVAYLPDRLTFAMNRQTSEKPFWAFMVRLAKPIAEVLPVDTLNPMSMKTLINRLKEDRRVVIFPEGRLTLTGALMKVYEGSVMVAQKAEAPVLPIRIDGAQYTFWSRMGGKVRRSLFAKVRLTVLPERKLDVAAAGSGRTKRGGNALYDLMSRAQFEASPWDRQTLTQGLLDAIGIHGAGHVICENINPETTDVDGLTYGKLLIGSQVLGRKFAAFVKPDEAVGVMLPNANATVAVFFGLHAAGAVPAMLNFTTGVKGMLAACHTAKVRTVLTSRRFVTMGGFTDVVEQLAQQVNVVYLEDIAKTVGTLDKLHGLLAARLLRLFGTAGDASKPAVILFTSGSEGTPKAVVLSHANLNANRYQVAARVDFTPTDKVLNALPMFHSFGLTAGTILPIMVGIPVFLFPSPLKFKEIPEVVYDSNATILFGTDTFLAGYAKYAHVYDFYRLRLVLAGAEKLKAATAKTWFDKFGVRIFEGYGATETSPVLSVNTPMECRPGSVGRLLPGMEAKLEAIPGITDGARLHVRGPNVMMGYMFHDNPGVLVPPSSQFGNGWYDTGDIVALDPEGYITIKGRAKRFAKIAGEMVPLNGVEDLANRVWANAQSVVTSLPDDKKGEQLVLLTTERNPDRADLLAKAKAEGLPELFVPRKIFTVDAIPLLGTGKTDYVGAKELAEKLVAGSAPTPSDDDA